MSHALWVLLGYLALNTVTIVAYGKKPFALNSLKEKNDKATGFHGLAGKGLLTKTHQFREKPVSLSKDFKSDLMHALNAGCSAGLSAAWAGLAQVVFLMWLRTIVNFQYRYGGSIVHSIKTIYAGGGIFRFYNGLVFAIFQGPLAKFGAVAANEFAILLIGKNLIGGKTSSGVVWSTAFRSIIAGMWRAFLVPLDTCKIILQVEGKGAFWDFINGAISDRDPRRLYNGASALLITTSVAHYPWFITYNYLNTQIPLSASRRATLIRSALIGFVSSTVSDCFSNPLRVIKTYKQCTLSESAVSTTYRSIVLQIIERGGLISLFGRGLLARIVGNGIQNVFFTIFLNHLRSVKN